MAMRTLVLLAFPVLVQLCAYVVVYFAAQGGGSFMGLLAMPVAALSFFVLLAYGLVSARRRDGAILRPLLAGLSIALLPPLALIVFRALES